MTWGAVAMGGSALIGAAASDSAANKQVESAKNAQDLQMQMFNTTRGDTATLRNASNAATNKLQAFLGISTAPTAPNRSDFELHSGPKGKTGILGKLDPLGGEIAQGLGLPDKQGLFYTPGTKVGNPNNIDGFDQTSYDQAMQQYQSSMDDYNKTINDPTYGSLLHQFNADDLKTNLAPNYDFMLQQGQGATNALANKGGGLISGNAMKGINDYTQNYASNAYQNAFSNYNTNQTNIFNRLSAIAGFGQQANQTAATSATAAGQNIGNSIMAGGQAAASGIVGGANAISNGLSNAGSWYGAKNLLNNDPGTTGTPATSNTDPFFNPSTQINYMPG